MALKCTKCGRLFGQKNKFESHILICGNEVRPFVCPEAGCPKAYRSKWSFDNHLRTVHPKPNQDPITFPCEYCGKNLGSKQALDNHRKQKHLKKVSKTKIGYDLNRMGLIQMRIEADYCSQITSATIFVLHYFDLLLGVISVLLCPIIVPNVHWLE